MAHSRLYRSFMILQEEEKGYSIALDKALSGYAKIEGKNDRCRINFYAQNLKKDNYSMLLICSKKGVNRNISIGNMNINDLGRAEISCEYDVNSIGNTGIAMNSISGAAIVKLQDNKPLVVMCGYMSGEKVPEEWRGFSIVGTTENEEDKEASTNVEAALEEKTTLTNIETASEDKAVIAENKDEGVQETLNTEGAEIVEAVEDATLSVVSPEVYEERKTEPSVIGEEAREEVEGEVHKEIVEEAHKDSEVIPDAQNSSRVNMERLEVNEIVPEGKSVEALVNPVEELKDKASEKLVTETVEAVKENIQASERKESIPIFIEKLKEPIKEEFTRNEIEALKRFIAEQEAELNKNFREAEKNQNLHREILNEVEINERP